MLFRSIDCFERGIALVGEESTSPAPLKIAIRAGQCWELDGKVLEIVAFSGNQVECLEWTPSHPLLFTGVKLVVTHPIIMPSIVRDWVLTILSIHP